jgi:hypothetical protein
LYTTAIVSRRIQVKHSSSRWVRLSRANSWRLFLSYVHRGRPAGNHRQNQLLRFGGLPGPTAKDILNVQDDVAKAVAQEIQLRLTSQQQAELARQRPVNPEAFDAYLQGYHFFQGNTEKEADMAAKYFERATQLDPSYALAWALLSRARNWQANEGLIPMEEGRRLSREAVERVLALNPNLAEAHFQMWRLKNTVDYDWVGANASLQRAVALEPGNPEGLIWAAYSAAALGRFEKLSPWPAEPWIWIRSMQKVGFTVGRLSTWLGS